jgi:hypothetical protein
VTLFAGDEYEGDDVTSGPVDDEWFDYCERACPDDVCRSMGECAWSALPPSRRVVSIETTGDRL